MKIYDVVENNGREYEDNDTRSVLITEDKNLVIEKIMQRLQDDDFTPNGYDKDYTIQIYTWENGKCLAMDFIITPKNKTDTMDFLDTL